MKITFDKITTTLDILKRFKNYLSSKGGHTNDKLVVDEASTLLLQHETDFVCWWKEVNS